MVAGGGTHMAQVSRNWCAKFEEPPPYALVGDIQPTLRKQIFHISIAQCEPGIEPYGMANDFRWKAMAFKAYFLHLDRLRRSAN